MWYGCAIPLFFGSLKALHHYEPALPSLNLSWSMPYVGSQTLQLRVIFALVGFSYLINTSISAGLWVFQLIAKARGRGPDPDGDCLEAEVRLWDRRATLSGLSGWRGR